MARRTPFLGFWLCLTLLVPEVGRAAPPSMEEIEELVQRGELDRAVDALREILAQTKDPRLQEKARRELLEILQRRFKDPDSGTIRWQYQKPIRQAYEDYLRQNPNQADVLLAYGEFLFITQELQAAEDVLSRALFYGEGGAARLLGRVRHEQAVGLARAAGNGVTPAVAERFASAAEAFGVAAEGEPADPQLWYELGLSQFYAGDMEGARASMARALALKPDSVEALKFSARASRRLGRLTESIELYLRWATKDGGFSSYLELAEAYAEADQPNRAIFYFDKAKGEMKRQPAENQAALLNNYAWYLCTTKNADWDERRRRYQLELAYRMAEQAVTLTGRQKKEQLDTLAEAAFLLGRPREAAALEAEAVALDPINPYYRAQQQRFEEAALKALESGQPIRLGE